MSLSTFCVLNIVGMGSHLLARVKLCLGWQVAGLFLDWEGVLESGTLLITPPTFAEDWSIALLLSNIYSGFFL